MVKRVAAMPKLIEKAQTAQTTNRVADALAKPKNPPVPRFAHPLLAKKDTNKEEPLIEMPKKKPRPPPVPDALRASAQKPTIAQLLEEKSREATQPKKPRVPKVSELMPGARLIKPGDLTAVTPVNATEDKKTGSPQRKIHLKGKPLMQTPSVANIHKPTSISDE